MKKFFFNVLSTFTGIVLFVVVVVVLGLMSVVGMVAASDTVKEVDDNSVLVLKLKGTIEEYKQKDDTFDKLLGGGTDAMAYLNELTAAIDKAKDDKHVKGILIEAGYVDAGYATLQELRSHLEAFKKSGKWIVAYGDDYTQRAYYVASVANKVYINPEGSLDWRGIGAQPMFIKDLAAKAGIKFSVVKVGTFKSATEPYTEEHMSEASRLQTKAYIDGIWSSVCKAVSASRGISVDSLNAYADGFVGLEGTAALKKRKMVDATVYERQMRAEINKLLKAEADEKVKKISVADMLATKDKPAKGKQIAVYYASGSIVQDNESSLYNSESCIAATKMCRDLEKLMDDDDVAAVVLRINSGGGSAYASEQIWDQVCQLKSKKPVVVSMGDYAASGAYYISAPASWVVAQPNTLTGSIGIFGLIPDMSGLFTGKLGIKYDEVKTNRNSTFGNLQARSLNAEELAALQAHVNRGYVLFRKRVCDGRKLRVEDVEKIAQGRVWLGSDALGLKLVNQLGGLDDAVKKAAELAKAKDYYTEAYPAMSPMFESILSDIDGDTYMQNKTRAMLGELYEPFVMIMQMRDCDCVQARMPFDFQLY